MMKNKKTSYVLIAEYVGSVMVFIIFIIVPLF